MKREWTKEQKDYIINSYTKDGLTCTEIARKFAAKPDTISKYLKEWGVVIKRNRTKNRRLREDYFSDIDTTEKAYFLGLLLADGSVTLDSVRKPNIRLELVETDKDILIKLRDELCSDASLYYNKRSSRINGTYSFSIRSQQIADDLAKFNIVPNKTYLTNHIIFPEQFIIDFLRGYVDGDGSIYYSGNLWHISITSHSEQLLIDFRNKIDELIKKERHLSQTKYNGVYKITWNGRDAQKIATLLYKDDAISITRKRAKAMAAQENKRVEDIV